MTKDNTAAATTSVALRAPQAAKRIGVSERTFHTMRKSAPGFPPARELSPRCLVWLAEELDEWLRNKAPRIVLQPHPSQLRRARIKG